MLGSCSYSPKRSTSLSSEVGRFVSEVRTFVGKYQESPITISLDTTASFSGSLWSPMDQIVKQAAVLNEKKARILGKCHLLPKSDAEPIEKIIRSYENQMDRVLSKVHDECLSPSRRKKITPQISFDGSLLEVQSFQEQYEEIKEKADLFLDSLDDLSSVERENGAKEILSQWSDFVDHIKHINQKTGKAIFRQIKENQTVQDSLVNAEAERIKLWLAADDSISLLNTVLPSDFS